MSASFFFTTYNAFTMFLIVLTLADGLCCTGFVYPILYRCMCPETGTSSIDWAQLSRCHLKTEPEFSLRNGDEQDDG
jgi:hypothetical protein